MRVGYFINCIKSSPDHGRGGAGGGGDIYSLRQQSGIKGAINDKENKENNESKQTRQ